MTSFGAMQFFSACKRQTVYGKGSRKGRIRLGIRKQKGNVGSKVEQNRGRGRENVAHCRTWKSGKKV